MPTPVQRRLRQFHAGEITREEFYAAIQKPDRDDELVAPLPREPRERPRTEPEITDVAREARALQARVAEGTGELAGRRAAQQGSVAVRRTAQQAQQARLVELTREAQPPPGALRVDPGGAGGLARLAANALSRQRVGPAPPKQPSQTFADKAISQVPGARVLSSGIRGLVQGVPIERPEFTEEAVLRIAGSAAPAIFKELPLLAKETRDALGVTATKTAAADAIRQFTPDVAQQAAGAVGSAVESRGKASLIPRVDVTRTLTLPPAQRGLLQPHEERGPLGNYLVRVLSAVDRGQGLAEDFSAGFEDQLGPEWKDFGWWVGLLGDVATPFEAPITAAARAGVAAPKLAKATERITGKPIGKVNAFLRSLRGRQFDALAGAEEEIAHAVVRRQFTADQLTPETRAVMEDLAQARGLDVDDLARKNARGIGKLADVVRAPPPKPEVRKVQVAAGSGQAPDIIQRAIDAQPRNEFELWHLLRGGGEPVQLQPHQGYDALKWLEPGASPATPSYTLRDGAWRPVRTGTLDEVLGDLLRRQEAGDQVVLGQRRVANWRQRAKPAGVVAGQAVKERISGELIHNRTFSSPAERAVVKRWRAKPRSILPPGAIEEFFQRVGARRRPRPGFADEYRPLETYAAAASGRLRRGLPETNQVQREIVTLAGDAMRVLMRSQVGADRLVRISPNVAVAPQEARLVMGRINETWSTQGLDPLEIARRPLKDGKLPLSELESLRLRRLQARFGTRVPVAVDGVRPQSWRAIHEAIATRHAGRSRDMAHAIEGVRPFSESVLRALLVTPRSLARRGSLSTLQRAVVNVDKKALSADARKVLAQLESEIDSVPGEVLRRVKQTMTELGDTATPADALRRIMRNWRPVPPQELAVVDEALDAMRRALDLNDIAALRRRVLQQVKHWDQAAFGDIRSGRPDKVLDAIQRYAVARRARVETQAQQAVRAHMIGTVFDEGSGALQTLRQTPPALLRQVYEDVFIHNTPNSPAMREVVDRIASFREVKPEAFYANWVRTHLADQRIEAAIGRLVDSGLGVRAQNTRLRKLIQHKIAGKELLTPNIDGTQAVVSQWTHGEHVLAEGLIRKWGLTPGSGADLANLREFSGALVPVHIKRELQRLQRLGKIDESSIITGSGALTDRGARFLAALNRLRRLAVTSGWPIPNPDYFMTNALGILPMMLVTQGPRATASAASAGMRHPGLVAEIGKALENPAWMPAPTALDARTLVTKSGLVYTRQGLVKAARDLGVGVTKHQDETAKGMLEALDRLHPGMWSRLKGAVKDWPEMVAQMANAPELRARVAVFVDRVEQGDDVADAAQAAKTALYDYRDISEVERRYITKMVLFYTFIRKNTDAHVVAMLDHPERIAQQFRAFRGVNTAAGQSDTQRLDMRRDDLARFPIYQGDRVFRNGVIDPEYQSVMLRTGMLGAPEAIFFAKDLLFAPTAALGNEEGADALRKVIGRTQPEASLAVESLTGVDPSSGFQARRLGRFEVPTWMMQPPIDEITRTIFDPQLSSVRDVDKSTADLGGQAANWKVEEPWRQALWRALMVEMMMGRQAHSIEQFWRATSDDSNSTRPWSTQELEMADALGFQQRRVRTPVAAARENLEDTRARLRQEERSLRARLGE